MINFAKYFFQGIKNTLRIQNGVNFAYKGPWMSVFPGTVLDEWYVGDFMAAEYTIVVDVGNFRKEIVKALVVAGPETASVTVYGKTNLGENLIELSTAVNEAKVQVLINPANSPEDSTYDNSTLLEGAKVIHSVTYYHTINDLVSY